VVLLQICRGLASQGKAVLSANGYSELVIAISPDVAESEELLEQLKSLMVEASRELYIATRNRAYFRQVKILLPKTWTSIEADVAMEAESFATAELRVDRENSLYGMTPYTLTSSSCGEPGQFTHLTPEFMAGGTTEYGNWGKVLVHEWAKLRWGVFEEHGYPGDSQFPMFFYQTSWGPTGQTNVLTPNFCVNGQLVGYQQDLDTQGSCQYTEEALPDHNCYYYATQETSVTSSYMSLPYLVSNTNFCDNTEELLHRDDLPNRHNFYCPGRSTWEVIMDSPDFKDGANPSNTTIYDTTPEFLIVGSAKEALSYVLVLDVSLSMTSNEQNANRMTTMVEAAKRWVKYELTEGVQLGITLFSEETVQGTWTPIQNLTLVTEDSRVEMVELINTIYDKQGIRTCIGCGLFTAANNTGLLGGKNGNTIVLITDGEQLCFDANSDSCLTIQDCMEDLVNRNIRVITIALGPDADEGIENLAAQTGGKTYFVQDHTGSGNINDAFSGSTTYQPAPSVENKEVQIYQNDWELVELLENETETQFAGSFKVDETLGRDLLFQVDISLSNSEALICSEDISLLLVAPDDDHVGFNITFKCNAENFGVLRIDMQGLEPPKMEGLWVYRLTVKEPMGVSVSVSGKAKDANTDPIITDCWIQTGGQELGEEVDIELAVRAEVRQGNKPVLGAKVKAMVERPADANGEVSPSIELELFDNGSGADSIKNDGAYTRYFTHYTGRGRYSVKCQVESDSETQINQGFIAAKKNTRVLPGMPGPRLCCGSDTVTPDTVLTQAPQFQRQATAGSFQVATDIDPSVDLLPPARVTDLTCHYKVGDQALTLSFTSPGDDLDSDAPVSSFTLKYSQTAGNLSQANFDSDLFNEEVEGEDLIQGSSLAPPSQGGRIVTILIDPSIFDEENQYNFALKAEDDAGNESPVSNICRAYMSLGKDVGNAASTLGLKFTILLVGLVAAIVNL